VPEALDEEHRALRARALEFVAAMRAQPLDDEGRMGPDAARALIAEARRLGLHGMTQPKAFGGSEAGALALTVVRETLAAANSPGARHAFGPGPGVLAGAEGVLKTHYLEPMLRGEKRAAFAFTEARDAPRHTQARSDGEFLVVDGEKAYVTGGAEADFLNVLVEVDGGARAMVVIDRDAPGVEIAERFRSLEGGQHARFRFHGVRVPRSHLLGTPGEGIPRAMRQIGDTRLLLAAEACGLMLWIDDFVARHLLAPHPSGEPLGAREGVRLRYADLRIDVFTARGALYRAARIADSGANAMNEVIIAKVYCTEALGRVVDTAIQLVGGRALDAGHPLEQLYRRVRSLRIAEGASDVLRLNLARGRLDLSKGTL
jgi:acyl-CoA dehydrogenase